jgi:dCTP deaminase
MILSMESIYARKPLTPLVSKGVQNGLSYGLSNASYDVRIEQNLILWPGRFALASTIETFNMPDDLAGVVMDKSTNARRGLCVQNTFIDPGFRGFLTVELTNHSWRFIRLQAGDAIAQIVFHQLDHPTKGYSGKYQDQQRGAQFPRFSNVK